MGVITTRTSGLADSDAPPRRARMLGGSIGAAAAETPDAQQAAVAAYCCAMQLLHIIGAYCSTYASDTRRGEVV